MNFDMLTYKYDQTLRCLNFKISNTPYNLYIVSYFVKKSNNNDSAAKHAQPF